MTDRTRRIIVLLDNDYREDDAEAIVNAIKMIKGVRTVTTKIITSVDYLARVTVRAEIMDEIYALLSEDK